MSNKGTAITRLSFFAAANGYSGFRSYFDKIFDPSEYTSLYILKGGPGTGKSSFMKRLLAELETQVDECEAIFCSSDPASLDGVIIKKGERRIGVIDGTSPHSRDPIFPGAIDKIINLGDNWDEEILAGNVDTIKELGKKKAGYYKCAYDYLSIAGELTKKADATINGIYGSKDEDKIRSLLHGVTPGVRTVNVRLVSAFGKDGFSTLSTVSNIASEVYSVVGVYGSEYVFMARVVDELRCIGANYTLFPSALDGTKADAVFIPSCGLAFTTERSSRFTDDKIIDTAAFLDQRRLSEKRDRLEFLWREREAMLWSSAEEFKKASEEHFKLERIYSAAMDFSKNDEAYGVCVSEIKKKLSL